MWFSERSAKSVIVEDVEIAYYIAVVVVAGQYVVAVRAGNSAVVVVACRRVVTAGLRVAAGRAAGDVLVELRDRGLDGVRPAMTTRLTPSAAMANSALPIPFTPGKGKTSSSTTGLPNGSKICPRTVNPKLAIPVDSLSVA